ncbi:MAG: antitoxin Xre/MbcA/ParS toxin-binding domain-containing protein [Parahaliea sp.]
MNEAAIVFKPSKTHQEGPGARAMAQIGKLLGLPICSALDMAKIVRGGIATDAVDLLLKQGYTRSETRWIVAPRTLTHRRRNQEPLSPEESGRLLRAAKLRAMAIIVLGDEERANLWLHKPRQGFGGSSAMDMMQTEYGGQVVEEALGQLDAGYFA